MGMSRQVLIFDADDTLWENNILFERVIADYLEWVDHPTLSRAEVRQVLDDIERANAVTHGYGTKMLLLSLRECFEKLQERPPTDEEHATIDQLAAALVNYEIELMPDVPETLDKLGERHELLMLTKGNAEEQQRKVDSSTIANKFAGIHIVAEKHIGTYHTLIDQYQLNVADTWMIGNSPRSDIRPARAAGLNAVFIPHPHTWVLEHDEVDESDDRILTVHAFRDLLDHF
ncbi:hydrolase [Actinosynnema sp. ALI-1.44]|uniref:HAD family hydrolase n=1 Tax=Actinosynnema sp. ALI-1.44 TaxID=1933779 RepID=UPI00097BB88A|nr:HAD family hydrolase [Actinosynnema sp. ALI-1.44]ONI77978.1 hydrolase [Actinosynnema sp. ALI-1.44]